MRGAQSFPDCQSDQTSSVNPSSPEASPSPSSSNLVEFYDDSAIGSSDAPNQLASELYPSFLSKPLSGSTGDLPSATQNSFRTFRRQMSAVETRTNDVNGSLEHASFSTKKTENAQREEQTRAENATRFAPGSIPQYKVIYKDLCEVASVGGEAIGDKER